MTATTPQLPAQTPHPAPRHPHLTLWRHAHPGRLYPSLVDRWGVQRDDGDGPLSRLISLAPDGVAGYTVIFDEDTRAYLDGLSRPERVARVRILVEALLSAVPVGHKRGSFVLRYGVGHGWHVHGLLDARAVPALTVLPGWDLKISTLATVDDVKRWAGYCVKHARRTRGASWSWQRDAVAERLLRDRAECFAQGLPFSKLAHWFGLPDRRAWTAATSAPEPKHIPTPRRTRPVPQRPPQPTPPVAHDQGEAPRILAAPHAAPEASPPA
jgi:hypothetical protein